MYRHILLLLAVCSNIVKAGPLRHHAINLRYVYPARDSISDDTHCNYRHNNLPRFVNETAIPSSTTPETSTPTTSTVSIPFSDDASLGSIPPSRISTNGDGQQKLAHKQDNAAQRSAEGIAINPEGVNAPNVASSATVATTDNSLVASPSLSLDAAPLTSIAESTPTAFEPLTTGKKNAQGAQETLGTAPASPNAFSEFLGTSNIIESPTTQAAKTETVASAPILPPPFGNIQSVGAQTTDTRTAVPATSETSNKMDQFQSLQDTETQSIGTRTAASRSSPGSQTPSQFPYDQSARPSSSAIANTVASQTNSQLPSTANLAATSNTALSQVNDEVINAQFAIDSSAPPTSSLIIKTSATPSANASPPTPVPSITSLGSSNQASAPQYDYPSPSVGNVAMATGFNNIFQGLDPKTKCDPNNADQASACVRGQPAKCEADGTYTLDSCDQGETCYALPLPDGQIGIKVGCQSPGNYRKAVAAGESAILSLTSDAQTAQNAASSPPVTATQQRENAAAVASVDANQQTSSTTRTKHASFTQADIAPFSSATPSELATNADSASAGFFDPLATFRDIQGAPISTTPTSTPAVTQTEKSRQADKDQQTSAPSPSPSPFPSQSSSSEEGSGVILDFLKTDDPTAGPGTEQ